MDTNTLLLLFAIAMVAWFFLFRFSVNSPPSRIQTVSRIQTIDAVGDMQNTPVGLGAIRRVAARQESEIRTHNLTSAKAIHEQNNIVRAEDKGVSVEALKAAEIASIELAKELALMQSRGNFELLKLQIEADIQLALAEGNAKKVLEFTRKKFELDQELKKQLANG